MRHSIVRISSAERTNKSSPTTDFEVSVQNDAYMSRVVSIALLEATIPSGAYNINQYNNKLYLDDQEGLQYILTVPIGQYTQSDLFAWLNNVSNNPHFTISQDPITKKYIATKYAVPGAVQFSIITSSMPNYMNALLGANINVPLEITIPGTNLTNLPDLAGIRNFYITSSSLSDNNAMISPTLPRLGVIAVVPNDSAFGGMVWYRANEELIQAISYPSRHNGKNICNMDLQLRDLAGRLIDLNGLDWSVVFKIYYA